MKKNYREVYSKPIEPTKGMLLLLFIPFSMRMHSFIGNLGEVATFYWLFPRTGNISRVNLGRGQWSIITHAQSNADCSLVFHLMIT